MTGCWWNDPARVAELLRWLQERGTIDSLDDGVAVVEKPYNWTREFTDMCAEQSRERRLAA